MRERTKAPAGKSDDRLAQYVCRNGNCRGHRRRGPRRRCDRYGMVRTVETAAALAHRNPSRAALSPRMRRRPAAGVEQVRGPYRAYALHALLVGAGMNTLLVMPRESGASTAASVLFDRPVVTGSPAFAGDDDRVDPLHSRTSTKLPAIA